MRGELNDLERAACEELDSLTVWLQQQPDLPTTLAVGMRISLKRLAAGLRSEKVIPDDHCRFYHEEA